VVRRAAELIMPALARITAFDILRKVETGGYASDLLLERCAGMDARDAGLASEIVFGTLRRQLQLDYLIGFYSGSAKKLDPEVRIALRMGIYQLRFLERVPAHAAVADSVDLVKRARKRSAAGFVNAVLRKVNREPVEWPAREVELSCPEWLLARWEAGFGRETAEGIARAALSRPETFVRGALGDVPREPTEVAGCFRLLAPVSQLPPGVRVQDIGSQSIVPLLQLEPGQRFLDLCAAPGNKTSQALESGVRAVACDIHLHRIGQLKGSAADLLVLDGTQPLPFGRVFDRILLDAPCSGTGTLARNPEIKWRLRPGDLSELHARQSALLANARAALAPGGLLVYSTCSLETEENEAVVAGVPEALVLETLQRVPGVTSGDGFFAAVIKSGEPVND
jgi:16S rRNA (cytosine967-C5)-methyltransferase